MGRQSNSWFRGPASSGGKTPRGLHAIGTGQSPLWIPYEAGIFRKYGIDVELLYVGSGSRTAQVVVSGETPIGMFNGGLVINANLAGADLVVVADGLNVLPFFLVTTSRIKNINELKGQKIGITRLGSATDYALRYAAEKGSFRLGKETPVLQLGGQPEMMAALKSGFIEAAILNAEAMNTVLSQLIVKDPKIATMSAEQFLDRSFLQELEKERFIESLWK